MDRGGVTTDPKPIEIGQDPVTDAIIELLERQR